MKTEEDEAFEYIARSKVFSPKTSLDPYRDQVRNDTIEEVARAVEKFRGAFGNDTTSSFAIYIRGMKR